MINRFKNALINAVSNTGLDASVVGLSSNSSRIGGEDVVSRRSSRGGGGGGSSSVENGVEGGRSNKRKYEYGRPHFLQLNTTDEIVVTADHVVRPIIVPRDLSFLPWESGYAEYV
jgi:protein phosphatase 1H